MSSSERGNRVGPIELLAMDKDGCLLPSENEAAYMGLAKHGFSVAMTDEVLRSQSYQRSTLATQASFLRVQFAQTGAEKLEDQATLERWVTYKYKVPVDDFSDQLLPGAKYVSTSMLDGHFDAFADDNFRALERMVETGLGKYIAQVAEEGYKLESLVQVLDGDEICYAKPANKARISVRVNSEAIAAIESKIDADEESSFVSKKRQKRALRKLAEQAVSEMRYCIEDHYDELTSRFEPPEDKSLQLHQLMAGYEEAAKDINITFADDNYSNYFELAFDKMSVEQVRAVVHEYLLEGQYRKAVNDMLRAGWDQANSIADLLSNIRRAVKNVTASPDLCQQEMFQFICARNSREDAILNRANVQFIHAMPKYSALEGGNIPSYIVSPAQHRLDIQVQKLQHAMWAELAGMIREPGDNRSHLAVLASKKYSLSSDLASLNLQDTAELMAQYFAHKSNRDLSYNEQILKHMLAAAPQELPEFIAFLAEEKTPLETQMLSYFQNEILMYEQAKDPHSVPALEGNNADKRASVFRHQFEWANARAQRLEGQKQADFIRALKPELQFALMVHHPGYAQFINKEAFVKAFHSSGPYPGGLELANGQAGWLRQFSPEQQSLILSSPAFDKNDVKRDAIHPDDADDILESASSDNIARGICLNRALISDLAENAIGILHQFNDDDKADIISNANLNSRLFAKCFPAAEAVEWFSDNTLEDKSDALIGLYLKAALAGNDLDLCREKFSALPLARRAKILELAQMSREDRHKLIGPEPAQAIGDAYEFDPKSQRESRMMADYFAAYAARDVENTQIFNMLSQDRQLALLQTGQLSSTDLSKLMPPKDGTYPNVQALPQSLQAYNRADIQSAALDLVRMLHDGDNAIAIAKDSFSQLDRRQKFLIYRWMKQHKINHVKMNQLSEQQGAVLANEMYDNIEWHGIDPMHPKFLYMKHLSKKASFDDDSGYLFEEMLSFFCEEGKYYDARNYIAEMSSEYRAALLDKILRQSEGQPLSDANANLALELIFKEPIQANSLNSIEQVEQLQALAKQHRDDESLSYDAQLDVALLERKAALAAAPEYQDQAKLEHIIDELWQQTRHYRDSFELDVAAEPENWQYPVLSKRLQEATQTLLTQHHQLLDRNGDNITKLRQQTLAINQARGQLKADIDEQKQHLGGELSPGEHAIARAALKRMEQLLEEVSHIDDHYQNAIAYLDEDQSYRHYRSFQNCMAQFVLREGHFEHALSHYQEASPSNREGYHPTAEAAIITLRLPADDEDRIRYTTQSELLTKLVPAENVTLTLTSPDDAQASAKLMQEAARNLYQSISKKGLKALLHERTYVLEQIQQADLDNPAECLRIQRAFEKMRGSKQTSLQSLLAKEMKSIRDERAIAERKADLGFKQRLEPEAAPRPAP